MVEFAETFAYGPTRVQLEKKDGPGFLRFKRLLSEHSATGSANTLLGIQRDRPSIYDLSEQMTSLAVPTLIIAGDEDRPCLAPSGFMKRTIASAGLCVMPNCGHAINLEDPDGFNRVISDFIARVDNGRWPSRNRRALLYGRSFG